jgi:hypothetical protein
MKCYNRIINTLCQTKVDYISKAYMPSTTMVSSTNNIHHSLTGTCPRRPTVCPNNCN